jgi:sterol desaturase/sphingolipid hydroxylase (fatty acid hydroxylase superfamily)
MRVVVVVLAAAVGMLLVEVLRPGRRWPRVSGWWLRAGLINGFQVFAVWLAGVTYDRWMRGHALWSAEVLGAPAAIAIGYLALGLQLYWSHRWRHEVGFLWRTLHQLHHSPQRVELLTAFYKHPVEIVLESILATFTLYMVCGLTPTHAMIATSTSGIAGLVYHWNIDTPRWLGYIIQRPESHCVHHQEGVHAFNYSELPLFDMIFGTFRNPARFEGVCGLGQAEHRFGAILLGRDVYRPPRAPEPAPDPVPDLAVEPAARRAP